MENSFHDVEFKQKHERLILKGQTLSLQKPLIMGILNTTPDSFSDGGLFQKKEQALKHAEKMIYDGASIIDIGGESTRPGSDPVKLKQELDRVLPIVEELKKQFPDTFLSIDTTKYEVAQACLDVGADIINDVSGLQKDVRFVDLCDTYDAGLIIMHSKGEPKTMQENPNYEDGVVEELKKFFFYQLQATSHRLLDRIIIDPGFGFGKTSNHNLQIAHQLQELLKFDCPILVGASRKRTLGEIIGDKPVDERLHATLAFHYDNLTRGAKILRVHDVKPAFESILVYNAIHNESIN